MDLWILITGFLLLLRLCEAEVVGASLEPHTLGLADIPPCGLQCMILTVPASGCGLDDTGCICNNEELAQTLAACMLANCTMSETLGSVKVQSSLCNFSQESKRTEMFMYTSIVYSIAILLVALRLAGKLVAKNLSLDDWVVIAALILLALPVGCVLAMTKIGFGRHLWNLEDGQLLRILRLFYISQSFYVLVLALIKVSLVFFYLQIFKTRQFRLSAYVVLICIVVNSLVIFFLTLFSCNPLPAFWNRDIKGKCLDVQALAYANSASAIVQDIVLLILPLVFIRHLQMKRYRKIAVGLMFSIGTFGCIATIVRLRTLLGFKMSIDPTWDYVPATIWTELELLAGFACVSLPSIRILVVKILPAEVKEFLSLVTRSSRSRSNPSSKRSQEHGWKRPPVQTCMKKDAEMGDVRAGTRISSLWSRYSVAPSARRQTVHSSRRRESTLSNYSDFDNAGMRGQPFLDKRLDLGHEQMQLLTVPRPAKSARQSLRDSRITALPPMGQIGCLPEGSFSDLDVIKGSKGMKRKRGRGNHVQ